MDNTTRRILAGIACEVGQLDGTIARLQEARDATERPEVRKEIHVSVLDELSRRADLALEAYDEFGVLTPMDEYARKLPLRAGWRYRRRVHIGQRDERFVEACLTTSLTIVSSRVDA